MKNSPSVNSCTVYISHWKSAGDFPANHGSFRECTTRDAPSWFPRVSWVQINKSCWQLSLSIQICRKKGINPTIVLWRWDWDHQTYSREGYGSLGYSKLASEKGKGSLPLVSQDIQVWTGWFTWNWGPPEIKESFETSKQIIQFVGLPFAVDVSWKSNFQPHFGRWFGSWCHDSHEQKAPTSLPWGFEKKLQDPQLHTQNRKHISSNQFSFFEPAMLDIDKVSKSPTILGYIQNTETEKTSWLDPPLPKVPDQIQISRRRRHLPLGCNGKNIP